MSITSKNIVHRFRIFLYLKAIRLKDRVGPLSYAVAALLVGGLIVGIFSIFRISGPSDWASVIYTFVAAAIAVFVTRKLTRYNAIFIEVTMSYIMHGGRALLDHLLGKMIGGTWRRQQIGPGDALFCVLENIVKSKDYEFKRRVSEALPVLAEIDAKRTFKIACILRNDFDARWKSDLRRRAIEALIIPPIRTGMPLLHRIKHGDVQEFLKLRENDEVYTALAITEVLHEWKDSDPDLVARLRDDMENVMPAMYPIDQVNAVHELIKLCEIVKAGNVQEIMDNFDKMSRSSNKFVRIAISRNFLCISKRFPEKTLDLMIYLLDPSQEKNVRRPIARENSVEFIIGMLKDPNYRSKANELIMKLVTDNDEIIRVGAFDKAEMLINVDKDLLLQICNTILDNKNETSEYLIERANQIKMEITSSE